MDLKLGELIYAKTVKDRVDRDARATTFKGHAIGLFLGYVKPGQEAPLREEIPHLVGEIGYVAYSDVKACLGDEAGEKLLKFIDERYK